MSGPDAVIQVVREWVMKAENDLTTARHTLGLGDACPTDTVCFHAQQCVEKYLKAFLTLQSTGFPRTHDIEELFRVLPPEMIPALRFDQQRMLTRYATVTRYPGAYEAVSLREARQAVAMARKVRQCVRRALPKESKTKMRKR